MTLTLNRGAGQAAGGGRHTVQTLQTGCVELFTVTVVVSEPAPGTGWHCLTVIH